MILPSLSFSLRLEPGKHEYSIPSEIIPDIARIRTRSGRTPACRQETSPFQYQP
ncbi:MAG: hypothetical protein ACLFT5_01150 [Desulfovermiculus sp.]